MNIEFTTVVAVATVVTFAGLAWEHLGTPQPWVRMVTGLGAAVVAIAGLLALV